MIRFISKGVSIFLTVVMGATMLMPATDREIAALGQEPLRFDLVQMRLAQAMMNVAPEFVVARYSEATKLPEDVVRAHLEAKANGTTMAYETPQAPVEPSNTRITSGGAKFVAVD